LALDFGGAFQRCIDLRAFMPADEQHGANAGKCRTGQRPEALVDRECLPMNRG